MTIPQRYDYGCKKLTAREIREIHPDNCSIEWIRIQLRTKSVADVLAMPVLSQQQIARMGKKASPWNRGFNYG
jgi:hypothetical protein